MQSGKNKIYLISIFHIKLDMQLNLKEENAILSFFNFKKINNFSKINIKQILILKTFQKKKNNSLVYFSLENASTKIIEV